MPSFVRYDRAGLRLSVFFVRLLREGRDLLDLVRSRSVEQEVVDLIDEPAPR